MKFTCFINHIPRLHQFDEFKDSQFEYWFLLKIGGIIYEDGKYLSDFYFINKLSADDILDINGGTRVNIKLNISFYTFFNVGCIFSKNGYLIKRPPYEKKTSLNTLNLSVDKFSDLSLKVLEYNDMQESIAPFDNNCPYFTFIYERQGQKVKVLISQLVICSYIFFRSTFITKNLLYDTLADCFDLSNIQTINLENRETALRIFYNNRKILPQEAFSIAQFFNISKGRNALNSVSGNLIFKLSNPVLYKEPPYLKVDLEFMRNIEMELAGKFLDTKMETFFLVYEIAHLNCQVNNESDYNNIVLEPVFKEENNYNKICIRRYNENLRNNNLPHRIENLSPIYYPHRPVFYTGTNVYINDYDVYDLKKNVLLKDFYSYHTFSIYRTRLRNMLSKEFLKKFALNGFTASNMSYNSLDNIISQLSVGNSMYFFIIYEVVSFSKFCYYIELSDEFIILMHNDTSTQILLIDLILIIENIIYNYGLENNRFRSFTAYDTDHYQSKYAVNIYFQNELVKIRKDLYRYNVEQYVKQISLKIKILCN